MLSEDAVVHKAIVAAMREWHRSNTVPPIGIGITANPANSVWEIAYGTYGVQCGQIRLGRDNFIVTHVTDAGGNFIQFVYNHVWGGAISLPLISAALNCPGLANNDAARSLIILMTSECARSILVRKYVTGLLAGAPAMNANDYATIRALTAEYGHTQVHVGGQAGMGVGWNPLSGVNHRAYNTHKQGLNVVNHLAGVNALIDKLGPV